MNTKLVLGLAPILLGCTDPGPETRPRGAACHLGEIALEGRCVSFEEGKADLPNGQFADREHDGRGYAVIAAAFGSAGHDLHVDLSALEARWPMLEDKTAVLNRFGTPILWTGMGYYHTALDVYRSDPTRTSDQVVAPFAGTARVFDWSGTPGYHGYDYSTVVAIWDPRSHVVAQLMHVKPSQKLIAAGTNPVQVAADEVIGSLAQINGLGTTEEPRLRHTHVDLIDGEKKIALNPVPHLPYRDWTAPVVKQLYALDSSATKQSTLHSGKLDLVVEVFDRDQDSARNLEIGSLSYQVYADGALVRNVPRCYLEHVFESVSMGYSFRALSVLDFGNASFQIGRGSWPSSDIDDRERTFRYALTQLQPGPDGKCQALDDSAGFVEVADHVQKLTIKTRVWDQSGNVAEFSGSLVREGSPSPPPTTSTPSASSCVSRCGARAPSGCYCDAECTRFGDCCADKLDACGP